MISPSGRPHQAAYKQLPLFEQIKKEMTNTIKPPLKTTLTNGKGAFKDVLADLRLQTGIFGNVS